MGYHLTILRSAHGKQVPIPLAEAKRVARDLGWTFDDSNGPSFVRESAEEKAVLWHQHDELWTSNPDEWAIGEMIVLAHALGARVRGDEFETYASLEEPPFVHPDDVIMKEEGLRASAELIDGSLREQRRIRNAIVGFFVVLGVVAFFIGKSFKKH